MQRKVAILGMAIAFVLAMGLALVYRSTRHSPRRIPTFRAPVAPADPAGAAPPSMAALPPRAPVPPADARPAGGAQAEKASPTRPQGSAQAPEASSDPALARMRPHLTAGLGRLQASVARCSEEAPAAGSGSPAPAGGPRTGMRGRTVLTLEVETLDGQLRIVDAALAGPAGAGDWRVACAQRKLRGQIIPAPSAKAGSRMKVPFALKL